MLSAKNQAEVLAMHFGQKKSIRWIARQLGMNRRTVRQVIETRQVKLSAKTGDKSSILDPYTEYLDELLKLDPSVPAVTMLQRIRDKGYTGSYGPVKIWARFNRPSFKKPAREAFLRIKFEPAQCAQVDWGEFGNVFGDGSKIHCFAIVLCYSRLLYIEFTRSEKFSEFIRCHENAFFYFGGVPRECWYDNLATAVTERMGSLIRFNERFMQYMGHHHIRPHACNVARGNEKGRVENSIKYIRSSFWAGRTFHDFDDLCRQAAHWCDEVANRREHRGTRKIPILQFDSEEKHELMPMNTPAYDTDEITSRQVPPQFHIVYETNLYSVPWTLVGVTLTQRTNAKEIRFFYGKHQVACHERSYKKNRTFTKPIHQKGLLERKPGGSTDDWRVKAVKQIGPVMERYLELIRSGSRSIRQELSKILILSTVYGNERVDAACEVLLKSAVVGVENLENLLKAQHGTSQAETEGLNPEPLKFKRDKLNRVIPPVDLRRYDSYLFESTRNTTSSEAGATQPPTETPHGNKPDDNRPDHGSGANRPA